MQIEFIVFGIRKHPANNIIVIPVVDTTYSQIPIWIAFVKYRSDIAIDGYLGQFIPLDIYFGKSMERKIINTDPFTDYFTDLQVFGYQPAIYVDIFEFAVDTTLSIKRKASGRCVYLCNNIEITQAAFRS